MRRSLTSLVRLSPRTTPACLGGCRFASVHWRHVEQDPIIPRRRKKVVMSPRSVAGARMSIDLSEEPSSLTGKDLKLCQSFYGTVADGEIFRFSDDPGIYATLANPVADSYYRKIYSASGEGFVQFREHMREPLKNLSQRYIFTGDRGCGKTMTLYGMLLADGNVGRATRADAPWHTEKKRSLVIPALHLARWFQDTSSSIVNRAGGNLDFPEINRQFLLFMLAIDAINGERLAEVKLTEDERWASQLFSFKGDSLLDVAKFGISNSAVSGSVIKVFLETLLEQSVHTTVLVDNANLLCEIHSSMLEEFRDPTIKNSQWHKQTKPDANRITLLRHLKDFIKSHRKGPVLMTVDSRNPITDQLTEETSSYSAPSTTVVQIPPTPNEGEYLNYLRMMQTLGFICRDLSMSEVAEFSYLTGRSYKTINKYMSML